MLLTTYIIKLNRKKEYPCIYQTDVELAVCWPCKAVHDLSSGTELKRDYLLYFLSQPSEKYSTKCFCTRTCENKH